MCSPARIVVLKRKILMSIGLTAIIFWLVVGSAQEPPSPPGIVMVPAMPTAELMGHIQMLQDRVQKLQGQSGIDVMRQGGESFVAGWQAAREVYARQQPDREVGSRQVTTQPKGNDMFAVFFWVLCLLWVVGIFVPDTASPYLVRGRSVIILVLLILLGLKVFPFNG